MPLRTLDAVRAHLGGSLAGLKILLLGVSYRQDVGDTRYSPSEALVRAAEAEGAAVTCQDPLVSFWPEWSGRFPWSYPPPAVSIRRSSPCLTRSTGVWIWSVGSTAIGLWCSTPTACSRPLSIRCCGIWPAPWRASETALNA